MMVLAQRFHEVGGQQKSRCTGNCERCFSLILNTRVVVFVSAISNDFIPLEMVYGRKKMFRCSSEIIAWVTFQTCCISVDVATATVSIIELKLIDRISHGGARMGHPHPGKIPNWLE